MLYNLEELNLINLAIFALATWRISSLLVSEAGPWNIFLRFRELIGFKYYETGEVKETPNGFLGSLFECVWCLSLWISLALLVFWVLFPCPAALVFLWLAGSAIAIVIEQHV